MINHDMFSHFDSQEGGGVKLFYIGIPAHLEVTLVIIVCISLRYSFLNTANIESFSLINAQTLSFN